MAACLEPAILKAYIESDGDAIVVGIIGGAVEPVSRLATFDLVDQAVDCWRCNKRAQAVTYLTYALKQASITRIKELLNRLCRNFAEEQCILASLRFGWIAMD